MRPPRRLLLIGLALTLHVVPVRHAAEAGGPVFPLGASFNGVDDTGPPTPDATIASGPGTVIAVRSSTAVVRQKSGALVASKPLVGFFAPVRDPREHRLTDPNVLFDPDSQRFFLVAADSFDDPDCTPGTCVAHILLAVPKTSHPSSLESGQGHLYAVDRTVDVTAGGTTFTANQGDFDAMAVVGNALVITSRMSTAPFAAE